MSSEFLPAHDSLRWRKYAGRDVIPLTVADMDFPAPAEVVAALQARCANGLFGYGEPWPSLIEAVIEHFQREYGWRIEAEWIVWLPGLVPGLHLACRAVGEAGDGVFTATPVYPPFLAAPVAEQRRLLTLPLVRSEAGWGWDFAAADAILRAARLMPLPSDFFADQSCPARCVDQHGRPGLALDAEGIERFGQRR